MGSPGELIMQQLWSRESECPVCGIEDPLPPEQERVGRRWAGDTQVQSDHIQALRHMLTREFPRMPMQGSGIVTVTLGQRYWPMTLIAAKLLRESGCKLPLQIWHDGYAEPIVGDPLTSLVSFQEMQREHPARVLRAWESKSYAMMHSRFERCCFIDSDAYFVADPAPLFKLLDRNQIVYWRDLHACFNNVHWDKYGLDPALGNQVPQIQGGLVFVNMATAWHMMSIYHWLNSHSDYTYRCGYGDQDVLRTAVHAADCDYRCIGPAPWKGLAFTYAHKTTTYCVHRCRSKLFVGDLPRRWGKLPLEHHVFELFKQQDPGYYQRYLASLDDKCPAARRYARQKALAEQQHGGKPQ